MSYDVVDEAGTAGSTTKRITGSSYARSVDTGGGERLPGYVSVTNRSDARALRIKSHARRLASHTDSSPYPAPARRDALRRELIGAANQAMRMETFSECGDLIELANAGFSLRENLAQLWTLRVDREDEWSDLVNLLQGALASEEFERLTVNQCQAIRTIIGDHLASGVTDSDDLNGTITILRRAGLDPFKSISDREGFVEDEET